MTYLHPDWYTRSKLPDGREGCIAKLTLRGALEVAAAKLRPLDDQETIPPQR